MCFLALVWQPAVVSQSDVVVKLGTPWRMRGALLKCQRSSQQPSGRLHTSFLVARGHLGKRVGREDGQHRNACFAGQARGEHALHCARLTHALMQLHIAIDTNAGTVSSRVSTPTLSLLAFCRSADEDPSAKRRSLSGRPALRLADTPPCGGYQRSTKEEKAPAPRPRGGGSKRHSSHPGPWSVQRRQLDWADREAVSKLIEDSAPYPEDELPTSFRLQAAGSRPESKQKFRRHSPDGASRVLRHSLSTGLPRQASYLGQYSGNTFTYQSIPDEMMWKPDKERLRTWTATIASWLENSFSIGLEDGISSIDSLSHGLPQAACRRCDSRPVVFGCLKSLDLVALPLSSVDLAWTGHAPQAMTIAP
ncbi:hypothetical protein BDV96DRAFT_635396 [Lophiotrema nucula]|uniref:Uncharacterized protein n=1 Tax=Lophiotrema nucula TaxID=690887 RepID=A0A6A5YVZ7_9PLEO|nr:hypothetical protein BDV96DRAFT_635396 [Lophiotrema nucula]